MRFLPSGLILCGLLAACAPNRDETQLHVEPSLADSGNARTASKAGATGGVQGRLASLPDRGELLAYDRSRSVRNDGAYAWHPVDLSEEHALRAIANGELVVRNPRGQSLRFRYQRHIEHADGNWTWVGRIAGEGGGRDAILTFGEHAVFGIIPDGDRLPLRLTMSGGRTWLVATDRSKIADIDSPITRPTRPDYLVPPRAGRLGAAAAQMLQAPVTAAAATASGMTYVDLVMGYTSGFKNQWGTGCNLDPAECERRRQSIARLSLISKVDMANQSLIDSQVPVTIRLVKSVEVGYPDKTSNDSALRELTGSGTTPVPAALLPLRNARDQYGADLVSLVRKFETPQNEGCGIAWLLGAGGQTIDAGDAPYGFSVVSDGSDLDETDNKSYFCRDTTLAHELGHNLGSAHDRATATYIDEDSNGACGNTTTPCLHYGRYPYSFGQKTDVYGGNFFTIMAYGDSGQNETRLFSNPRISICENLPCGVENQADNARSLTQTAPVIARFRSMIVPLQTRNDVDGNGKSDLLWIDTARNELAHWNMDGAQVVASSSWPLDAPVDYGNMQLLAVGGMTGSPMVDLVWSAGGALHMWKNGGTYWIVGYPTPIVIRAYPNGWNYAGTGDIDGDGKFDLLWRDQANTRFVYWIMDGKTLVRSWAGSIGPTWRLAASGDFNGDGKLDLVWASSASLVLWTGTGTSFVASTIRAYPAGWTLQGAADINADGKSDLLWRDSAKTKLTCWIMDGPSLVLTRTFAVGNTWNIGTWGDYNADLKADIVWSNGAKLVLWTGSGIGFASTVIADIPPGWNLIR
ncbi:FG-GAP-like repeat-containing protein [Lysobacter sp. CFH 32150]|uniref:FG-GAP-like repeat-containing protein n=1 Tax=Lysobacter sp. CFH 32150 TaxID=2927128 RepID=UPI001FA76BFC|nr:FG-GAP-like repeat-containing protein [Lysobacter sp. CFH 32150]MCI4567638.1 FG-GAP-like repeat-containing protein [Lysobacter sp. CFH 32150]